MLTLIPICRFQIIVQDIKADSTVSNLTVDNSTVYISRADGRDVEPTRLTITENYVGNNGVLHLRTELGDDNSATDKVVINGNTSGTTRVKVTNAGGSGAYTLNGIEIISVEGESNGEFIKDSRIFAGAYEYSLTRGNTEATNKNWYLTNFQQRAAVKQTRRKFSAYCCAYPRPAPRSWKLRRQPGSR